MTATPASATNCSEVVAATAADDGYSMPLAVTIRSAVDSLAAGSRLRLYVLDGGITPENRKRIGRSCEDPRLNLTWVQYEGGIVDHLPISHHVSMVTYFRLLLPKMLPSHVEKLIYFDSDMLVRRDLTQLYSEPLGDELALAVQDVTAPWMDANTMVPDERRRKHLTAFQPVPNYLDLGIRREAKYLNAGLLVFNAKRWREEGVDMRALECLDIHKKHVLWWDQYALNVVLADQWRPLDLRWNQNAGMSRYPSWEESPISKEEFDQLASDPWIVHFCSPSKPWHHDSEHPFRGEFFETLDRTDWSGWRPSEPEDQPEADSDNGWKTRCISFTEAVKSLARSAAKKIRPAA